MAQFVNAQARRHNPGTPHQCGRREYKCWLPFQPYVRKPDLRMGGFFPGHCLVSSQYNASRRQTSEIFLITTENNNQIRKKNNKWAIVLCYLWSVLVSYSLAATWPTGLINGATFENIPWHKRLLVCKLKLFCRREEIKTNIHVLYYFHYYCQWAGKKKQEDTVVSNIVFFGLMSWLIMRWPLHDLVASTKEGMVEPNIVFRGLMSWLIMHWPLHDLVASMTVWHYIVHAWDFRN